MKGFIEVTHLDGKHSLIPFSALEHIYEGACGMTEIHTVAPSSKRYGMFPTGVSETYSELKALIEAATEGNEEPPCVDCDCPFSANKRGTTPDYEITGFNGTRDALNNLGIRKEK